MRMIVNARFLTQKISGVQRYAIEISRQLKRFRPEIQFISPGNIIHEDMAGELGAVRFGRLTGYLWEQLELPIYLVRNEEKGLLINLANTGPLYYRNKIITIHDIAFLHNPRWYSKKFYYYYRWLIPRIAKNARLVVTDSQFSKSEIIDEIGIDGDRITVIPCGISPEFMGLAKSTSENRYGKYILSVSSIDPRKNLTGLISAFKRLDIKEIKLVIAGSKNEIFADEKIAELAGSDKRIILAGFLDDHSLIDLYRNAELFVYPSLYEGFGLPPLEAMACGCPCVVSNAASLQEVCGNAALYCDPLDEKDIAKKINMLFVDRKLREELVDRGYRRASLYSWEKAAKAYLEAIEKAQLS